MHIFGGVTGAFYGLLIDTFCGKTLGVYFALFLILGAISGLFKNKISTNNKLSLAFMIIFGTVMIETIYVWFNKLSFGIDVTLLYYLKVVFLEIIYNMFLTYILFNPFIFWGEIINRSRNAYL